MYKDFFGFRAMPFHITPDPAFLFLSLTHEEALQHLRYGIAEKKGFIVLTGEVGCGKTTLCRRLLQDLDEDQQIDTALLLNPRISETQLLRSILTELGESGKARSRNDLIEQMNNCLLERVENGRDVILIIDEAQNLSFEVLEMLRMLSNLETDTRKLLQIMLIGQPELRQLLGQKRLRQLRQRVLVHYDLKPLNRAEIQLYIHHRLTLAGGEGRVRFTPWAIRCIARNSRGIPRMINHICDKALLAAFVRESDSVNTTDVRRALKDIRSLS
jgi:general secretion pathway protein A